MNETQFPFLAQLRTELRRAAHEQIAETGHSRRPTAVWRLASVPALLAAAGVIAYLVLAAESTVVSNVPVINFSAQATAATLPPPTPGTRVVGNKACIKMTRGRHLPPLIRSTATPNQALLDELSLLRTGSAPVDSAALGNWDRYPLYIATVYERYVRIVNGPGHVRLAFLPVTYCTNSEVEPSGPSAPGGVFRESLQQGLVMLVLSNSGEHPPVLVGTAQQIKHGPALAGLGTDTNKQGYTQAWLQAIVVPDGISRVVMEFTPPFLHHYSAAVEIRSNVGVVVRRPDYTPTTVLWYDASGRLTKKFVDHQQLKLDNCLAAHKKTCFSKPGTGSGHSPPAAIYQSASNNRQVGPPALLAQADALYQPVKLFEQSITAAQTADANSAKARVTREINACDAPYGRQLFEVRSGTTKYKLYQLWNDVSDMQQQEVNVAAFASQLRTLASSWMALSLKNPAMNQFAHAIAAELLATLNAPRSAPARSFTRSQPITSPTPGAEPPTTQQPQQAGSSRRSRTEIKRPCSGGTSTHRWSTRTPPMLLARAARAGASSHSNRPEHLPISRAKSASSTAELGLLQTAECGDHIAPERSVARDWYHPKSGHASATGLAATGFRIPPNPVTGRRDRFRLLAHVDPDERIGDDRTRRMACWCSG
jgi:hypothetical protein